MSLILGFALFWSWFYFERKMKRRDEHDEWLYGRRKHLKAISNRFERECRDILRAFLANRNNSAAFFARQIKELQSRYIENLQSIYSEENRSLSISALPAYFVEAYKADIENVTRAYLDILYSASN